MLRSVRTALLVMDLGICVEPCRLLANESDNVSNLLVFIHANLFVWVALQFCSKGARENVAHDALAPESSREKETREESRGESCVQEEDASADAEEESVFLRRMERHFVETMDQF